MSGNGSEPLTDVFEECLTELEAGKSIDEIISSRAGYSDELRPLLEAAGAALSLHPADPPALAQHRGRTRLLVQAERLRRESPRRAPRWNWPRLAMQLTALLVIIAASLTSLVAASAQSLPGDRLYSVKLVAEGARLNAAEGRTRSTLEDTLRERRINEIEELLRLRRAALVAFEGVVTGTDGPAWEIGGLAVVVREETAFIGEILPGMYVEVRGRTTGDGELIADRIHLRAYAFVGTLNAWTGALCIVDDIAVLLTEESQLAPDLQIGDQVVVLAQVDDQGTVSARAILLAREALPTAPEPPDPAEATATPTPTPNPTTTTTEVELATPEPDPEADPEAEGTEDDEDDEFETEEPDDDDETEEPDDDDESDNSGPGSSNSGSGSDDDETEEPDDD
jgi:hypothetical protein